MSGLDETVERFQSWLHLPDPAPLLAVLAAVAANRLEGDPVWLLLVGPPGGGKSEILGSLTQLPNTHAAATLTEAALLSGTPKREHDQAAKGGLLRMIGEFGIIVAKDFGSVLSMNRDARALLLAALREIYDGNWTRHVGTDGGRTLHWQGKVGLVAGCTPTIDRHHAVMGAMGERFLMFRLPHVEAEEHARQALRHAGRERKMRTQLAQAVSDLFETHPADSPEPGSELTEHEEERLVALSTLIARCRSSVERDSYTREIDLIPPAEAPSRLALSLERLLAGLYTLGADQTTAWQIVAKAALDSMPAERLAAIVTLLRSPEPLATPIVAEQLGYPTTTARRSLEDLTAHGVAHRAARGQGRNADTWELTSWARTQVDVCFPDLSANGAQADRLVDLSGELEWH